MPATVSAGVVVAVATETTPPVKLTDVGNAVETQWSLDESSAILACKVKCYIHPPGHDVDHV